MVGLGGAIGSILRFLTTELFLKFSKNFSPSLIKFPIATFSVNILGSMLAGVGYYYFIRNFNLSATSFKNFVMVGILGGFTTFSAFSLDFFRLFQSGNLILAFNYAFFTIIFSFGALFLGFYFCKIIFS